MTTFATTPPLAAIPIARAQLVALGRGAGGGGQGAEPWAFAAQALDHLRANPADSEVRFLLAGALIRLGLPTLALQQLDALPAAAKANPAIAALGTRAAALPDERVSLETRIATSRANVEALATRAVDPIDLRPALAAWEAAQNTITVCRAASGDVVIVHPDQPARLAPDRADAVTSVAKLLERHAGPAPGPIHLEGASPPWWLAELLARTPPSIVGAQTPIYLLSADVDALLTGLSLVDLREHLAHPRVRVFAGSSAADRFREHLLSRLETHIAGPVLSAPTVDRPMRDAEDRTAAEIVDLVIAAQNRELAALKLRLSAAYADRTAAALADRFHNESADRPRILLPTTRFSTVLQHSARDFAAAFTDAGCPTHLLIEPDDTTQQSPLALARAIDAHRPDAIILINYTRAALGEVIPPQLPVVTWVQDAMPHLFTRQTGSALGERDWVIGHLHPEFFRDCAYPAARTLATPLVVSARKFHDAPVDAAARDRLACELAHVGNQSETAEALRDRLIADARSSPRAAAGSPMPDIIAAAYTHAAALVQQNTWTLDAMDRCAAAAVRAVTGRDADPATLTLVANAVCRPIADRLVRHQTLAWAAELCARRGWRLHLYGRGWDRHPTLAPHARGVLHHGDELRAAYQAARAHLHASSSWMLHQRIMECALSGGLTLVRRKPDDLELLRNHTFDTIARNAPDAPRHRERWNACYRALGLDAALPPSRSAPTTVECWGPEGFPEETIWLLGDLAQTTFANPAELEAAGDRAVNDDAWRAEQVHALQTRTRANLTYEALAQRLLAKLGADLASEAAKN